MTKKQRISIRKDIRCFFVTLPLQLIESQILYGGIKMDEKEKKSKAFVIIMSIVVILLIVIGTLLSWEIIQDGRKK